jgi:hypothetical protein
VERQNSIAHREHPGDLRTLSDSVHHYAVRQPASDHQNAGRPDDHLGDLSTWGLGNLAGRILSDCRGNPDDPNPNDYRGNPDDPNPNDYRGNPDDLSIEGNARQRIWTSYGGHHVNRGSHCASYRPTHRARTTAFPPADDPSQQAYPKTGALKKDGSHPKACRNSNATAQQDGHH